MEESLVLRFTLDAGSRPSADEVREALGDSVESVKMQSGAYEVTFVPAAGDESDALWLMLCEIGASFPGAVLAE